MYEEFIQRGAAWLDEHDPGWERKLDLATLDLASDCNCILGQLYGSFNDKLRDLFAKSPLDYYFNPDEYGFMTFITTQLPTLTEEWIAFVKQRFDSGKLSG